jgi:hypothetical protein
VLSHVLFPSPGLIRNGAMGLLLVSAVIASTVLLHADRVTLVLGTLGSLACGVILSLSSIFGFMARLSIAWFEVTRRPTSVARGQRFLRAQSALLVAFFASVALLR